MYYKSNSNSNSGGGISFWGALTLIFIVLKLMGVIDWPWLLVLAPLWVTVLLIILIIIWIYKR